MDPILNAVLGSRTVIVFRSKHWHLMGARRAAAFVTDALPIEVQAGTAARRA